MLRTLKSLVRSLPARFTPIAAALFLATAAGCVLYGNPDEYKTCADVACGKNASCGDGQCFCDAGHEGNPYTGCDAVMPVVDPECTLDCGQNAYCSEGECYCELDHVYVCGPNAGCMPESRLCDKTQDCQNGADEALVACAPSIFQEWLLTDSCDDNIDIEWRLFSQDRDWAWPNIDTTFKTTGFGIDQYQVIQCFEGETICFAGKSGSTVWGFNLDGSGQCDACCARCGQDQTLDIGLLTCDTQL